MLRQSQNGVLQTERWELPSFVQQIPTRETATIPGPSFAHKYPAVRSTPVPYLQSNPDIAHESVKNQAEKLLIPSLQSAGLVVVIVIDGLDEFKDKEISSEIPSALDNIVERVPKVKFFITSRQEPRISYEPPFSRHPSRAILMKKMLQCARCLPPPFSRPSFRYPLYLRR